MEKTWRLGNDDDPLLSVCAIGGAVGLVVVSLRRVLRLGVLGRFLETDRSERKKEKGKGSKNHLVSLDRNRIRHSVGMSA